MRSLAHVMRCISNRMCGWMFWLSLGFASLSQAHPANSDSTAQFLKWYWQRPLAIQQLPKPIGHESISLSPSYCSQCHVAQFQGWTTARHSHAMDAGVLGQLLATKAQDHASHAECMNCHAPLAEQELSLTSAIQHTSSPWDHDPSIHEQGVVCAACHVRDGHWYGPPHRDGSGLQGNPANYPHAGWKAETAFEDSRFCAACHQFPAGGYALHGKMIENTYVEWRQSTWAQRGYTCQSCHMPDRQHLWRGIHDPVMTLKAFHIDTQFHMSPQGLIQASLQVRNTGAGHDVPTYVTPHIILEAYQTDVHGNMLVNSLKTYLIARQVSLDVSREIADTRLPPGGRAILSYHASKLPNAQNLVLAIRVEPDAFYNSFYKAKLDAQLPTSERINLEKALEQTRRSPYELFRRSWQLPL